MILPNNLGPQIISKLPQRNISPPDNIHPKAPASNPHHGMPAQTPEDKLLIALLEEGILGKDLRIVEGGVSGQLPALLDDEKQCVGTLLNTPIRFKITKEDSTVYWVEKSIGEILHHIQCHFDLIKSYEIIGGAVPYLLKRSYLKRTLETLLGPSKEVDDVLKERCTQNLADIDIRTRIPETGAPLLSDLGNVLVDCLVQAVPCKMKPEFKKDLVLKKGNAFSCWNEVLKENTHFFIACCHNHIGPDLDLIFYKQLADKLLFSFQDFVLELDMKEKRAIPSGDKFGGWEGLLHRVTKILIVEKPEKLDEHLLILYWSFLSRGYRCPQRDVEEILTNKLIKYPVFSDETNKTIAHFLDIVIAKHHHRDIIPQFALTINVCISLSKGSHANTIQQVIRKMVMPLRRSAMKDSPIARTLHTLFSSKRIPFSVAKYFLQVCGLLKLCSSDAEGVYVTQNNAEPAVQWDLGKCYILLPFDLLDSREIMRELPAFEGELSKIFNIFTSDILYAQDGSSPLARNFHFANVKVRELTNLALEFMEIKSPLASLIACHLLWACNSLQPNEENTALFLKQLSIALHRNPIADLRMIAIRYMENLLPDSEGLKRSFLNSKDPTVEWCHLLSSTKSAIHCEESVRVWHTLKKEQTHKEHTKNGIRLLQHLSPYPDIALRVLWNLNKSQRVQTPFIMEQLIRILQVMQRRHFSKTSIPTILSTYELLKETLSVCPPMKKDAAEPRRKECAHAIDWFIDTMLQAGYQDEAFAILSITFKHTNNYRKKLDLKAPFPEKIEAVHELLHEIERLEPKHVDLIHEFYHQSLKDLVANFPSFFSQPHLQTRICLLIAHYFKKNWKKTLFLTDPQKQLHDVLKTNSLLIAVHLLKNKYLREACEVLTGSLEEFSNQTLGERERKILLFCVKSLLEQKDIKQNEAYALSLFSRYLSGNPSETSNFFKKKEEGLLLPLVSYAMASNKEEKGLQLLNRWVGLQSNNPSDPKIMDTIGQWFDNLIQSKKYQEMHELLELLSKTDLASIALQNKGWISLAEAYFKENQSTTAMKLFQEHIQICDNAEEIKSVLPLLNNLLSKLLEQEKLKDIQKLLAKHLPPLPEVWKKFLTLVFKSGTRKFKIKSFHTICSAFKLRGIENIFGSFSKPPLPSSESYPLESWKTIFRNLLELCLLTRKMPLFTQVFEEILSAFQCAANIELFRELTGDLMKVIHHANSSISTDLGRTFLLKFLVLLYDFLCNNSEVPDRELHSYFHQLLSSYSELGHTHDKEISLYLCNISQVICQKTIDIKDPITILRELSKFKPTDFVDVASKFLIDYLDTLDPSEQVISPETTQVLTEVIETLNNSPSKSALPFSLELLDHPMIRKVLDQQKAFELELTTHFASQDMTLIVKGIHFLEQKKDLFLMSPNNLKTYLRKAIYCLVQYINTSDTFSQKAFSFICEQFNRLVNLFEKNLTCLLEDALPIKAASLVCPFHLQENDLNNEQAMLLIRRIEAEYTHAARFALGKSSGLGWSHHESYPLHEMTQFCLTTIADAALHFESEKSQFCCGSSKLSTGAISILINSNQISESQLTVLLNKLCFSPLPTNPGNLELRMLTFAIVFQQALKQGYFKRNPFKEFQYTLFCDMTPPENSPLSKKEQIKAAYTILIHLMDFQSIGFIWRAVWTQENINQLFKEWPQDLVMLYGIILNQSQNFTANYMDGNFLFRTIRKGISNLQSFQQAPSDELLRDLFAVLIEKYYQTLQVGMRNFLNSTAKDRVDFEMIRTFYLEECFALSEYKNLFKTDQKAYIACLDMLLPYISQFMLQITDPGSLADALGKVESLLRCFDSDLTSKLKAQWYQRSLH